MKKEYIIQGTDKSYYRTTCEGESAMTMGFAEPIRFAKRATSERHLNIALKMDATATIKEI